VSASREGAARSDAAHARFTCVALDLPLGAHRVPLDPEADLSPAGCGALIAAVVDALALGDYITLVAGGARRGDRRLPQRVSASRP
jgi:hypothetical protein